MTSFLDKIKIKFNKKFKQNYEEFIRFNEIIKEFITNYGEDSVKLEHIDEDTKKDIRNKNNVSYEICSYLVNFKDFLTDDDIELIDSFILTFDNFDDNIARINKNYFNKLYNEFYDSESKIKSFVDNLTINNPFDRFIDKNNLIINFEDLYKSCEKLMDLKDHYKYNLKNEELISKFMDIYSNLDSIVYEINDEVKRRDELFTEFIAKKINISEFVDKYDENRKDLYIDDYENILDENKQYYELSTKLKEIYDNSLISKFVNKYDNFKDISLKINEKYITNKYNEYLEYKPKILTALDKYQSFNVKTYVEFKYEYYDDFIEINEFLLKLINIHNDLSDDDSSLINNFFDFFRYANEKYVNDIQKLFSDNKSALTDIVDKYTTYLSYDNYIEDENKFIKRFDKHISLTRDVYFLYKNNELKLDEEDISLLIKFINLYDNFDDIILKINTGYLEKTMGKFLDKKNEMTIFVDTYNTKSDLNKYIDDKNKILNNNLSLYEFILEIKSNKKFINQIDNSSLDLINKFLKTYNDFDNIIFSMNKKYVNQIYRQNKEQISKYTDVINKCQDYYISNSKLEELLKNHNNINNIVKKLLKYCREYDYLSDIKLLNDFPKTKKNIKNNYKKANESFIEKELENNKEFFNNINGLSLDLQQRQAVIIDDDTNQIIAGAGTGKTLVLQAKIKYLIEKRGVNPEDIIAISYSNASVNDLKSKIPENIDIRTIHSLANYILEQNEESPNNDDNAINRVIDDYFLNQVPNDDTKSKRIIDFYGYYRFHPIDLDDISTKGELYDKENGMDFESLKSKVYKPLKNEYSDDYVTFRREYVKSLEELYIANFLFISGINYQYEKYYKAKTDEYKILHSFLIKNSNLPIKELNLLAKNIADELNIDEEYYVEETRFRQYKPDFYLPEYDIYLEHFGVDKNNRANWLDKKDSDKYYEQMKWKRKLHKKYDSKLLETYSYYLKENRLLECLEEKLKKEGVIFNPISYREIYERLINHDKLEKITGLIKLIKTFINHFKGNNFDETKFIEIKKQIDKEKYEFAKTRHNILYNIIKDVYDSYQNYLQKEKLIDFNDMINNACRSIEEKGCPVKYKYILVDEYQDISFMRYLLLKTIQDTIHSKIIAVGDDWQSIYRFSGSELELFTKMDKYYKSVETQIIEKTYRNSQELIDISGNFVMENPEQLKKELKSEKNITNPIKIFYYNSNSEEIYVFKHIIDDIINSKEYDGSEILVLGRNRKDIERLVKGIYLPNKFFTYYRDLNKEIKNNHYIKVIYLENKNIDIKFRTIHGSKGLEANNVVVINFKNNTNGFPNKIEDDTILQYVKLYNEEFRFAEERRLFYVALTRTKSNCYLLSPKTNKSEFINELEKNENIQLIQDSFIEDNFKSKNKYNTYITYPTNIKCPECKTGDIQFVWNNKNNKRFLKCSHRQCNYKSGSFANELNELNKVFKCPKCGDILIKRNGRYGSFFGCANISCKFTMEYEDNIDENGNLINHGNCPKCKSNLIKKNSGHGTYLKCFNPYCNYSHSIE